MTTRIDTLKSKWSKIGFSFTGGIHKGTVDVEELIIETLANSRNDSRLFSAVLTWVTEYGDLINVSRLKTFLAPDIQAICGCALEIAVKEGADKKLEHIIRQCNPIKKKEIFYYSMEKMEVTRQQEKEETLKEFSKWGFYGSSYTIKKDTLRTRNWILKQNANIAYRQLFGANIKAEIFSILIEVSKAYISQISKKSRLSYPPVYNEIESMVNSGLLHCDTMGRMKIISLPKKTQKFLLSIPY